MQRWASLEVSRSQTAGLTGDSADGDNVRASTKCFSGVQEPCCSLAVIPFFGGVWAQGLHA